MDISNHGKYWSATEDQRLRVVAHHTDAWIAKDLKRTPMAIKLRRAKLGIPPEVIPPGGTWSGDGMEDPPVARDYPFDEKKYGPRDYHDAFEGVFLVDRSGQVYQATQVDAAWGTDRYGQFSPYVDNPKDLKVSISGLVPANPDVAAMVLGGSGQTHQLVDDVARLEGELAKERKRLQEAYDEQDRLQGRLRETTASLGDVRNELEEVRGLMDQAAAVATANVHHLTIGGGDYGDADPDAIMRAFIGKLEESEVETHQNPKLEEAETAMSNTDTTAPAKPEPKGLELGSVLADAGKIAAGATVLSIVTRTVSEAAEKAGLPALAVKHPFFQAIVKLAAPAVLRAIAQRVPHIQDVRAVDQVLRIAQVSAVASVAQDTIEGLFDYVAPAFKQIGAAAAKVEQLDSAEAEG